MAGMLQILTYLLSFYLFIKGIEVLQIGLASGRSNRGWMIFIGVATLCACITTGGYFSYIQDRQAESLSRHTN
ncbi:MAG: hypothetical protein ABF727_09600 [Gluconobacter oxydans]